ncbi:MAG: NAD-dependent epimerase/dehydratase family protein [Desemzia incerta]|uniref:NAD-dependent epimerase/dehydratase family protein n=1 Tax=Desemzia incerta TaxID=82801 RepID=UPI00331583A2
MVDKRILIIGENSYIGTSFINYCKTNNINFSIAELNVRGNKWKSFDFSNYDVIFHVAGIAHNSTSSKMKDSYYKVNRDLTIEVAKKAKKEGVQQFIFMSSMIVFGNNRNGKTYINNESKPNPNNFYGDSKLKAEKGLEQLKSENFKVVILRPPMIYGRGSKGNYPLLAKLAKYTPIFPNYPNKRSVLYIDNLCNLICLVIKNNDEGKYHPQNADYIQTSEMVKQIAISYKHKIWFTKLFNPIISAILSLTIIKKVFGDLVYDLDMSAYRNNDYQKVDFQKSIEYTETER